jgi:hypothetical protein
MKTTTIVLAGLIAASLPAFAKAPANSRVRADYIAHEWGTFTSVQGSDGVQLEWNPFVVEELPKFVYNAMKPAGRDPRVVLPRFVFPGKDGFLARQRMETPVIYFYADKPQKVDVAVDFPEGRFTEWFPQLAHPEQIGRQKAQARVIRGAMRWGEVEILPGNGADEAQFFPKDDGGSHYYSARETDASGIRVTGPDGKPEYEKFLFYRGVAQFEAPLTVRHWGDNAERVSLHNRSKDKLGSFFIYAVRGGKAALVKAPALDANVRNDVDFQFEKIARPIPEVRAELAESMRQALVSDGLYPREAAAMVKTWDESWFGEPGTRVLYLLPQKWSDEVLPLKLTPAPKALKRVFVGRAELITPAQEWAVLKEVIRYAEGGSLERRAAVAAVADLNLGRFTDAAARRLQIQGPQAKDFSQAVWALLDATRPAPRGAAATTTAGR